MNNYQLPSYLKLGIFLGVLFVFNIVLILMLGISIYLDGPTMQMLFFFELLLLLVTNLSSIIKFGIHVRPAPSGGDGSAAAWGNTKTIAILTVDFLMDTLQLVIYGLFMFMIVRYYAVLPLYLFRDVFFAIRSFKLRWKNLQGYRKVRDEMYQRFYAPTQAEIDAGDRTCTVCFEDMLEKHALRLPCNHTFHAACLLNWMQRQQCCPV